MSRVSIMIKTVFKSKSCFLATGLLWGLCLLTRNSATGQEASKETPVKIAIIGDTVKLGGYVDLLTNDLGRDNGIIVLERTAIEHVLKEHEIALSQRAENCIQIGHLLGADGVIVLKEFDHKGKKMLSARLVGVNTGAILENLIVPSENMSVESWTGSVLGRFRPLFGKLEVTRDQAVPISLMNIRSPIDDPEFLFAEKQLTVLMSQRLMLEKEFFVLERWKMGELVWEKELSNTESGFWAGSYIVDGELSINEDGQLIATVRGTNPKTDKSFEFDVACENNNFADPIESIVKQLRKRIDKTDSGVEWDILAEGEMYYQEGEWALRAELYDLAVEAAEAAAALGLKKPELQFLRVKGHCGALYRELEIKNYFGSMAPLKLSRDSPMMSADQLNKLIYVLGVYRNFVLHEPQSIPQNGISLGNDWRILGANVLLCSANYLFNAHRLNMHRDRKLAEKLKVLRRQMRRALKAVMEHGEDSQRMELFYRPYVMYLPYFYDTPADSVDAYKQILRRDFNLFPEMRKWIKESFYLRDLYRKHPYLVSWDGTDSRELEAKWREFTRSMARSTNNSDRVDSCFLDFRNCDLDLCMKLLWDNRESIRHEDRTYECYGYLAQILKWKNTRFYRSHSDYFLRYLKYLLDSEKTMNCELFVKLFDRKGISDEEYQDLKSRFLDFEKRAKQNFYLFQKTRIKFGELEKLFRQEKDAASSFPIIIRKDARLSIDKIIKDGDISDIFSSREKNEFILHGSICKDGQVWFWGQLESPNSSRFPKKLLVFLLNPEKLSVIRQTSVPLHIDGHKILGSGQFYFESGKITFVSTDGNILEYQVNRKKWKYIESAKVEDVSAVCRFNGKIYIGYGSFHQRAFRNFNSGIIEFDPETKKTSLVASNRRKPARHKLDNCKSYEIKHLFSPGGRKLYIGMFRGRYNLFSWNREKNSINTHTFLPHWEEISMGYYTKGIFQAGRDNAPIYAVSGEKDPIPVLCYTKEDELSHFFRKSIWKCSRMFPSQTNYRWRLNSAFDGKNLLIFNQEKEAKNSYFHSLLYRGDEHPDFLYIPIASGNPDDYVLSMVATENTVFLFGKNLKTRHPFLWCIDRTKINDFVRRKLSAPEISPDQDCFTGTSMKIYLNSETEGAQIRYTLNGSNPSFESELYTKPVTVRENTEIRAAAFADGRFTSDISRRDIARIPKIPALKDSNFVNGLKYRTFHGSWASPPDFSRSPAKKEGYCKYFDLSLAGKENYFAIEFTGYLDVPEDGIYTFTIDADDSGLLIVDGVELAKRMVWGHENTPSGKIALSKGKHPFELIHTEIDGEESLKVKIKGPGLPEQYISPHVLFVEKAPDVPVFEPETEFLFGKWDGVKTSPALRKDSSFANPVKDASNTICFGKFNDSYMVGDWNGDGRDTVGVRRGNTYMMDFDGDGVEDFAQRIGGNYASSIIGDWDGDGRDNVALIKNGRILMDIDYDGHHDIELELDYELAPENVLAGDWNGDGRDTFAICVDNTVKLDTVGDGVFDKTLEYENVRGKCVAGDWNGNGKDSPGFVDGNKIRIDNYLDGIIDSEMEY